MWYTPLGSRPASAECSRTYQKLVQGERKSKLVCIFPNRRLTWTLSKLSKRAQNTK